MSHDLEHDPFSELMGIDVQALAAEITRLDAARRHGPHALAEQLAPYLNRVMHAPGKSIEEAVFKPRWPEGLRQDGAYEFRCDDKGLNGRTWMRVIVAPDGDAHVAMQEWEDDLEPSMFPTVRCRTEVGGGRHSRVHQALLWLARAMQLDHEDIQRRRGLASRG